MFTFLSCQHFRPGLTFLSKVREKLVPAPGGDGLTAFFTVHHYECTLRTASLPTGVQPALRLFCMPRSPHPHCNPIQSNPNSHWQGKHRLLVNTHKIMVLTVATNSYNQSGLTTSTVPHQFYFSQTPKYAVFKRKKNHQA